MSTDTAPLSLAATEDEPSSPPPSEDAPKRRKPRSDAGQPRGPRGKRKTALAGKIASGVHLLAAAVSTVDPFDGIVIGAQADKLGAAWAPVVEQNPRIAAMFANLEKGGVWGAAIIATAGVVLPIMVRHMGNECPPLLRAAGMALMPDEAKQFLTMTHEAAANDHRPHAVPSA